MIKKIVLFLTLFLAITSFKPSLAHQPIIVGDQTISVTDPEISRAFYDELAGIPQRYFIDSSKSFDLYINLLVPLKANPNGRYSAKVYDLNNNLDLVATIDGPSVPWSTYYETFGKDYYYKGPEFNQLMPAGKYAIDVYSGDNQDKYVLALGQIEDFSIKNSFNIIGTLRNLKVNFFNTSPFELVLTIFGIIYLVSIFVIAFIITLIYKLIVHKSKKPLFVLHKDNFKKKMIYFGIFLLSILLGLYFWNPIIIFLADIFILNAIFD